MPSVTGPTSRRLNLAASFTLLITAGLTVWGSFAALFVDTQKITGERLLEDRLTMWGVVVIQNGRVLEEVTRTTLVGTAAIVASILLLVAAMAVLTATRANGRNPWARALTGLAAGWTVGAVVFVAPTVLDVINSASGKSSPNREVVAGLGMWLLSSSAVLAVAVTIALTMRDLAAPKPATGVHLWAERAPGVIPLTTAAVVATVASFLALYTRTITRENDTFEVSRTLWGQREGDGTTTGSSETVPWGLPVVVVAGLLLVSAALLLINDRRPKRRRVGMFGRLTASIGAGILGGFLTAVAAIVLQQLFTPKADNSRDIQSATDIGTGTYLLGAAVILAVFGAIRGGKPIDPPGPDAVDTPAGTAS